MSVPIDTRRLSPPETPRWPSSPITACTRIFFFDLERVLGSLNSAANMRVSSTVSIGNKRSSCITYADITLSNLDSNCSPLRVMVPFKLPFAMRLARASISVDFPDPEAPITAMISPSRASPEMSSRIVFVPVKLVSPAAAVRRLKKVGRAILRRAFVL
ncbi:hypothetical protein ACJIZ3_008804 [Penstemon smallii]|uniref:Uncharacterized protein n=1 Tax=Penstemon smallii TaxID=265156 RepID=A0ABD3TBX1_9LAMI